MSEIKAKAVTWNDIDSLQKQIADLNNKIDYAMKDITEKTIQVNSMLSEFKQKLKEEEDAKNTAKTVLLSD